MRKYRNEKILPLLLIGVMLLSMCGCGSVYEKSKDGYTTVTSIEGVEFEMPENFLTKATTISSIEKDGDYAKGVYLYKDGSTQYILFDIDEAVIAVEKGTRFNLAETDDIQKSIKSSCVSDIWMTGKKDKISYRKKEKDKICKVIAEVVGNVSITPELYGKYTGYFGSVQCGDYECSIFAGVKVSEEGISGEKRKILSHIVKSLRISSVENEMSTQW